MSRRLLQESAGSVPLQVSELRKLVAKQLQLPADRLRLVHKGATLWDGRDAPTLTDAGAEHSADANSDFLLSRIDWQPIPALCCASTATLNLSPQIRCSHLCHQTSKQPSRATGTERQRQLKMMSASGDASLLAVVLVHPKLLSLALILHCLRLPCDGKVDQFGMPLIVTGSGRVLHGWSGQRRSGCAATECPTCSCSSSCGCCAPAS